MNLVSNLVEITCVFFLFSNNILSLLEPSNRTNKPPWVTSGVNVIKKNFLSPSMTLKTFVPDKSCFKPSIIFTVYAGVLPL